MKFGKNSPVTEFAILLALLLPINASQADNFTASVYQGYSTPPQTWNDVIWQPGPVSPTAGNTYEVLSGGLIRNPLDDGIQTFPGDSLILDPGSRIRATGWSGATLNFPGADGNPGLILNGGKLQAGPGAGDQAFTIAGRMSVVADSSIDQGWVSPGLIITAQISGSANLVVVNGSRRRPVDIQSADNPYTGNWLVMRGCLKGTGNGSLGTGNITVANGASFEVGYDIQSPGALTLLGGNSVMILHQDCQFNVVTISGVTLSSGTYTYDQLVTLFPGNFADGGSGSITIFALSSLPSDPTATDADQQGDLSSTDPSMAADDSADPSDVGDGSDPTADLISVAAASTTLAVTDTTAVISVAPAFTTLAVTDTTAPTITSAEMVSANSSSQITIRWNASTDTGGSGLAGYYVYRNGALAGRTTGPSYVDSGLSPSTQYCYTVVAYDNAGNSSSGSAQACVVTASLADTTAPSISSGVMVTVNSSTQITIRWNSSTDIGGSGVAGYRVYRNGLLAGTTTATSYADSGLTPSTLYCYTIVAYDAAGNNAPGSAQACATTSVSNPPSNVISSDRLVSWQGNVGIPGGIPNVTTIYANIAAGASLSQVNAAISACPSGQVVNLGPGDFAFDGDLSLNNKLGVVLRGAGPGNTTITFSSGGVTMKGDRNDANLIGVNLSQDAVKGAATIFIASVPSWVTPGKLIGIDQIDDPAFSTNSGSNGGNSYRGALGYGARGVSQLDRVVSKTSTSVTFEVPMYWGWQTSRVAQIFQPHLDPSSGKPVILCGIENLTLAASYSGNDGNMVTMDSADNCWVKNCVITNMAGGAGVLGYFAYRCEVRHCTIINSHLLTGGQGYGVAPYYTSSGWLTEDNIFALLHAAMDVESASGNVFAYNYETGGQSASGNDQNDSISAHQTTSFMNLWEGNFCDDKVLGDWTHGANAYGTVFRCRITGTNAIPARVDDSQTPVSIQYYNRYWNIVGNVLGVPGVQNKYLTDNSSTAAGSTGSIIKVGGDNPDVDYDADSYTSGAFILIHGNWDSVQHQVTWNSLVTSHTLTNSYYLSSKPSYFGSLAWPPYDPASPSGASATNIPAGYRYISGTN